MEWDLKRKINLLFGKEVVFNISTLNRIENGKVATFKPQFLERLAEFLDVDISEFFGTNGNVAIQNNDNGQNINVLNQTSQSEKLEGLYEKLLQAKDVEIQSLKNQIEILKTLNTPT